MTLVHHTMGTVISLDLRRSAPPELLARAFAVLSEADATFSPFRADSELSRVARGELQLGEASEELRAVLSLADTFERASGGVFSVRHGGRLRSEAGDEHDDGIDAGLDGGIDANGIVKGWAAQRAALVLAEGGATDFCLNAGGDLVTRGVPKAGERWQAGIRDPHNRAHILGVVVLGEGAMATSGSYERGAHIVDGRTGMPADYWSSVTVIDRDLTVADVLATTVFAMGADGPAWARAEFGCSVIAISASGRLAVTGPVTWA